jgi:PLP dependent protein
MLKANIADVRERISKACSTANRTPSDVLLVGVTKYVEADTAFALWELGLADLAENRIQELSVKAAKVKNARWHMIGHLQTNKAVKAVELATLIHGADSVRVIDAIDAAALRLGKTASILLEVNVSGEESKYGFSPDTVRFGIESALKAHNIRLAGLMTMAPLQSDAESSRPCFAALRSLMESLRREYALDAEFRELSMGMSNDFEVAVAEGATIVRVGSALFKGIAHG